MEGKIHIGNRKYAMIDMRKSFKGKLFRWFDYVRTKKEAQAKVKRLKGSGDILFRIVEQLPEGGWNIYTRAK